MSALTQLTYVVAIFVTVLVLMAVRRRVLARVALRNIVRRRKHSVIVVAGLMIATAMISAALVVGDTLDYIIKDDVFESTGDVDIVLTREDDSGINQFFNMSIAYDLVDLLQAGEMQYIDEVAPSIREVATVLDPVGGGSVPAAYVFAFDRENSVNDLALVDGIDVTPDMLTGGKAIVNEDLAGSLDLEIGEVVTVYPKNGLPVHLEVSAVAKDEGMGGWRFADMLFVDLAYAQESIFAQPAMITTIDISCRGSMEDGYLLTDEALGELESVMPEFAAFKANEVKRDGVEDAEYVADAMTQLFLLMSSFTIIAGVALIINIFVMLAEERKPEMGISRAVGMQRADLTQAFVFEGAVYAFLAAAIGAFVGLLMAFVMIVTFSRVISGGDIYFAIHFELESLVVAALGGFLITLLTVLAASWRVSKLNIVRAIRDIPEPLMAKGGGRYTLSGLVVLAFALLLIYSGVASEQAVGTVSGMSMLPLGVALLVVRFVSPRVPFTLAGLWMIFYCLDPLEIDSTLFGTLEGNLEMFVASGVLTVTGGVLMAMFNSDLMLTGLVRIFGRGRSLLPVVRTAVSYPMNKKFRTGLTVFIFALIMFTVTVIAMNASFQRESVEILSDKFSGGFEIVGFSLREVPEDNRTAAAALVNSTLGVDAVERMEVARTALVTLQVIGVNEETRRNLVGLSDEMLSEGYFSLSERAEEYASDLEAWDAVREDPDLVILDGTVTAPTGGGVAFGTWYASVGDTVTMTFANGTTADVTVIGIMDQMLVSGAFTSKEFVQVRTDSSSENLFYIDTVGGTDVADDDVRKALEDALAEFGLTAIVVRDTVEEVMSMSSSIMQLMEIFLGIGLVVGIAGLGIITIRNISERRQEIGVMRAIGYQKRMILNTFLIETSFVSVLGIVMGIALGLLLSYRLFEWAGYSEYSQFVVPWGEVALVFAIAFIITVLSTLPPSRAAARLAPAEALRRVD